MTWCILIVITGPWTLFNAYIGFEVFANPATNMEQGFAVIGWEVYLVLSLPIDLVFAALLFHPPQFKRSMAQKDDLRDLS